MSAPPLSSATKALLSAAKSDGPGAAARAKVWGGVSGAVGGVAGAAASGALGGATGAGTSIPVAATTAGMSAAKMLTAGTLLGAAVTVGLASMLLRVGPSPIDAPPAGLPSFVAAGYVSPGIPADTVAAESRPAPEVPGGAQALAGTVPASIDDPSAMGASKLRGHGAPPVPPTSHARSGNATTGPSTAHPPKTRGPAGSPLAADGVDVLAREAGLVAQARAALAGGDASTALRLVREARSLPGSMLGPEELTVEARALRALGDADEATGVDATLRSRFPDSALAK